MDAPTDARALYDACAGNDDSTRSDAYRRLFPYLYRVAFHVLRDQPGADGLAQDAAQTALIRVHTRLASCREPSAFLAWSRRIATHAAIDELRSRRRLVPDDDEEEGAGRGSPAPAAEAEVVRELTLAGVRAAIDEAPISDRSRRVVVGRYLDDRDDDVLAREESKRAGRTVLPSHVQVTRAKDIARLRSHTPLRTLLGLDGDIERAEARTPPSGSSVGQAR